MSHWANFVANHWGKLLGGLAGLIFAFLLIQFGVWRGLFIVFCVLAGAYIGWRLDSGGNLKDILERLLPPRNRF